MAVPKSKVSRSKKRMKLAHDYATFASFVFTKEGDCARNHRKTKNAAMAPHLSKAQKDKKKEV